MLTITVHNPDVAAGLSAISNQIGALVAELKTTNKTLASIDGSLKTIADELKPEPIPDHAEVELGKPH